MSISLFFESGSAPNYDKTTSTFSVNLQSAIRVPAEAKLCKIRVVQSEIWNLVSNVDTSQGNKIRVDIGGTGTNIVDLTIPDGQYSVEALNISIQNALIDQGELATVLTIEGDAPTQRVKFSSSVAGTIVSFPAFDYMFNILGFSLGGSLTLTLVGVFYLAPNIARFNNINAFLLHSDIADAGIPVNGDYLGVIAKIPITAPSGSLIVYQPGYPISIDATGLIGQSVQNVQFWLTDESGTRRVNTREDYSVLLEIVYEM